MLATQALFARDDCCLALRRNSPERVPAAYRRPPGGVHVAGAITDIAHGLGVGRKPGHPTCVPGSAMTLVTRPDFLGSE
ncbi:MAG: hypothetical protein ACI8PT_002362 [Gammaproteobacteria bacterium]|jgi:hypothetical protein